MHADEGVDSREPTTPATAFGWDHPSWRRRSLYGTNGTSSARLMYEYKTETRTRARTTRKKAQTRTHTHTNTTTPSDLSTTEHERVCRDHIQYYYVRTDAVICCTMSYSRARVRAPFLIITGFICKVYVTHSYKTHTQHQRYKTPADACSHD